MEEKYIIDTNIVIYYLDGNIPDSQLDKIENIFIDSFNISTITKMELLGWQKIDLQTIDKIESFLNNAIVYYIDQEIETKTIKLKQKNKIAVPDAILASTALVKNFTIVTRNEKDFRKIKNISIYNPFSE